jgi:hypothetical protein
MGFRYPHPKTELGCGVLGICRIGVFVFPLSRRLPLGVGIPLSFQ